MRCGSVAERTLARSVRAVGAPTGRWRGPGLDGCGRVSIRASRAGAGTLRTWIAWTASSDPSPECWRWPACDTGDAVMRATARSAVPAGLIARGAGSTMYADGDIDCASFRTQGPPRRRGPERLKAQVIANRCGRGSYSRGPRLSHEEPVAALGVSERHRLQRRLAPTSAAPNRRQPGREREARLRPRTIWRNRCHRHSRRWEWRRPGCARSFVVALSTTGIDPALRTRRSIRGAGEP